MEIFDSYDQPPFSATLPSEVDADLMAGLDIDRAGEMLADAANTDVANNEPVGMFGSIGDSFAQAIDWAFGDGSAKSATKLAGQGLDKLDALAGNPTAQKLASAMLPVLGQAYAADSLLKEKLRAEERAQEQQAKRAQWAELPREQFKPVQQTGLLASAAQQGSQQQALQQLALQQKLKEVR
ncbi:hypothetical protein [Vogesella indigofera]|uniref:hypothetical protein n=1 Tax=Vogesella indigofera TaxID=45465 RepID=UPI00234D2E24|nr:hypothetical protein [Vogesella indigofera]MDC7704046.1 hypothetical protein [Vogesella indigofera]